MSSALTSALLLALHVGAALSTASWAVMSFNEGSDCSGAAEWGEWYDPSTVGPLLLDACIIMYRGSPDQTEWIWAKSTCNDTAVIRRSYSDSSCTIEASDSSFNADLQRGCGLDTAGRTIQCDVSFSKAVTKAYMIGPGGDTSKCTDGYQVGEQQYAIDACFARQAGGEWKAYKATCDSGKVVMMQYADVGCNGASETLFTVPADTCAAGWNSNAFLGMKEGCGLVDADEASLAGPSLAALLVGCVLVATLF